MLSCFVIISDGAAGNAFAEGAGTGGDRRGMAGNFSSGARPGLLSNAGVHGIIMPFY